MVDLFLVYKFIRKLVTSFKDWPAFKEGIIDKDGNILIKRKEFTDRKQKDAFGVFDLMILNIKKLLGKLPGGTTKLASYASALWLIREWNHFSSDSLLTENVSDDIIEESVANFINRYGYYITSGVDVNNYFQINEKKIVEEPTVSAGSGAVAGIGVGDDGEPGLTPAQQKKYKKKNLKSFLKR